MDRRPAPHVLALVVGTIVLLGCAGGSVGSPSGAGSASPSVAAPPSTAPSIDSAEDAARLVLAENPLFEELEPKDPELIGQCCWYDAREVDDGYEVIVELGWGDCPAGCIERHRWLYAVTRDGEVGLIDETGEPVPSDGLPIDGGSSG